MSSPAATYYIPSAYAQPYGEAQYYLPPETTTGYYAVPTFHDQTNIPSYAASAPPYLMTTQPEIFQTPTFQASTYQPNTSNYSYEPPPSYDPYLPQPTYLGLHNNSIIASYPQTYLTDDISDEDSYESKKYQDDICFCNII